MISNLAESTNLLGDVIRVQDFMMMFKDKVVPTESLFTLFIEVYKDFDYPPRKLSLAKLFKTPQSHLKVQLQFNWMPYTIFNSLALLLYALLELKRIWIRHRKKRLSRSSNLDV